MRKVYQIFVVIILSFTMLGSSNANMDGIFLYEYPKQSLLYESLQPDDARLAGRLIVLPEKDFDQAEAAGIIKRLTTLPESIKNEKTAPSEISVILIMTKTVPGRIF